MTTNSQSAIHAGDRTNEVMRVLGRTTRTEALITTHEPNQQTAFRTLAGDLTAHGHQQTQQTGNGTTVTYHAEANLDGTPSMAGQTDRMDLQPKGKARPSLTGRILDEASEDEPMKTPAPFVIRLLDHVPVRCRDGGVAEPQSSEHGGLSCRVEAGPGPPVFRRWKASVMETLEAIWLQPRSS